MFMTDGDIRRAAPAAFSEAPAPFLSDRYGFVNTMEAINVLRNEGYQVVKAQQDNPAKRDPRFVRHMLTLRHESQLDKGAKVGEFTSQMLLINSHNGRTQLHLRAGLYRYVCSNGMVIGTDAMHDAIRHSKSLTDTLLDRVRKAAALADPVSAMIEQWKKTELTEAQAQTYALRAAELRFGTERAKMYSADALLEVVRQEDEGRSLWNIFNRVQENTTMRAVSGANANGRAVSSRVLTGITENTVYNERLWRMTEEVAALAHIQ